MKMPGKERRINTASELVEEVEKNGFDVESRLAPAAYQL